METLDALLFLHAIVMVYFAYHHLFLDDGGLKELGYSFPAFMPRGKGSKAPAKVPAELDHLLEHAMASVAAGQLSLATMCLLASFSEWVN